MSGSLHAVAVVVLFAPWARAQVEGRIPGQAIAWIAFDPAALGATLASDDAGAAVERAMSAWLGSLLGDAAVGAQMGAPLGRATAAGHSWRWCLLEYQASWTGRAPRQGGNRRIESLACILEVRHGELEQAGDAVVLAGGRSARVRRSGDPWREMAWCRDGDAAVLGFGSGALERWFGLPEGHGRRIAHRQAVGFVQSPVLEAYIDVNALRAGMPEWFSERAPGRVLAGLSLSNARDAMVQVAMTREGLLTAALTWSARSEPVATVRSIRLTEDVWPEGITRPADAKWTAVARADWPGWAGLVLDTYAGAGDEFDELARQTRRTRWFRDHGRTLERLVGAAGPFVAVHGGEGGTVTIVAPFTAQAVLSRVEPDTRGVFGTISGAIQFDPQRRIWSVRLGSGDGAGAQLEWMLAGPPGGLAIIGTLNPEGATR